MKRVCQLAVGLFFASALLIPFIGLAGNDAEVLGELRDHWMLAMKQGDAAKLASLFAENATLMPPGFPSFNGRKAIESFYRDGFAVASVRSFEFLPKEHHNDKTSMLERGTYQMTIVPKNEEEAPYTMSGRYLLIGNQRPDGQWEILWEIHTIENKIPLDQL